VLLGGTAEDEDKRDNTGQIWRRCQPPRLCAGVRRRGEPGAGNGPKLGGGWCQRVIDGRGTNGRGKGWPTRVVPLVQLEKFVGVIIANRCRGLKFGSAILIDFQ
jgi:hypothetical protein